MQLRTDLALEAVAMAGETLGEADRTLSEQQRAGITVTRLTVKSERAAAVYDKPCGEYVTLALPPLSDDEKKLLEAATLAAEEIRRFLPKAGTVPTVVDAATVAADCGADAETVERIAPAARRLVVTPREIDLLIGRAARLVAAAINAALQPDYAPLELISLALDS